MTASTPTPGNGTAPYAVVGATGQQGGAVARALLERGVAVRALVRDPDAAASRELVSLGATLARADLDDATSLREALTGVAGVFAMTTFATPRGTEGEVEHGRTIADAAVAAGVPHLVYSSVGGAERGTGIPHFESKWRVEQHLREVGVPLHVLRPTFFMNNFAAFFAPVVEDGVSVLRAPLQPGVPLQMIAVSDIGELAATVLLAPERVADDAIEIAGDELTAEQVAEVFAADAGLTARFEALPVDVMADEDQEAMFTWFQRLPAYTADFAGTRALLPRVTSFADFSSGRVHDGSGSEAD